MEIQVLIFKLNKLKERGMRKNYRFYHCGIPEHAATTATGNDDEVRTDL